MKLLKTGLKFWQEVVFAVLLGVLLIEMITKHAVVFHQTVDVACFCFCLILFICLIGQFFWKNKNLAFFLSIFLVLTSVFLIFASLYALGTSLNKIQAIAMLGLGLFLIIAAIKMPGKFRINK